MALVLQAPPQDQETTFLSDIRPASFTRHSPIAQKHSEKETFMATTTLARPKKNRAKRLPKGNRGGIELLLIHNVEHLGKQGDVVEVRPGYAFNYLLPQGLATIATDHHKRMVDKHKAKLETIARERLAGLRSLLEELVRTSVTIEANANDEGHLYGSVGTHEISRSLKQQDLVIPPDQIILQGPLKEVGLYTVKIRLAAEVEGDLKVWVVPASGEEK